MRALLVLALLLLPLASAQLPAAPAAPQVVEVSVARLASPVIPLGPVQAAEATVRISCALAAQAPQGGLPVAYAVTGLPAWARAVVVPPVDVAVVDKCDQGYVVLRPRIMLNADATAPAFQDGKAVLAATVTPPSGEQKGQSPFSFGVGYYGAIALSAKETTLDLEPGEESAFKVTLRNLGNAPARIRFEASATEGVTVEAPEPVTLASRASGASESETSTVVTLRVRAAAHEGEGMVNRGDPVTLKAIAVSDADPTLTGGAATASLRVNTVAATQESTPKETPLPGAAVGLSALVVVALLRRRC